MVAFFTFGAGVHENNGFPDRYSAAEVGNFVLENTALRTALRRPLQTLANNAGHTLICNRDDRQTWFTDDFQIARYGVVLLKVITANYSLELMQFTGRTCNTTPVSRPRYTPACHCTGRWGAHAGSGRSLLRTHTGNLPRHWPTAGKHFYDSTYVSLAGAIFFAPRIDAMDWFAPLP